MLYKQLEEMILTPEHYISGMHALNIHDYDYHIGDWHAIEFWNVRAKFMQYGIMGTGEAYNTNPYLGNVGVFNVLLIF